MERVREIGRVGICISIVVCSFAIGEYMHAYNIGLGWRLRLCDRLRCGCFVEVAKVIIAYFSRFSLSKVVKVITKTAIIFVFIVFIKVVVCLIRATRTIVV